MVDFLGRYMTDNAKGTDVKKQKYNIGQQVIFQPYEKKLRCTIAEVDIQQHHFNGERDRRVFYRLTGEAISITTSRHFRAAD